MLEHLTFSRKQLCYFQEKLDLQRIEQLLRANKRTSVAPVEKKDKPVYSEPELITFELPMDCAVGEQVEVPGCIFSATGDPVLCEVEEGFTPGETVDVQLPEGAVRVASSESRAKGKGRVSSSRSASLGASGPAVT